MLVYRFVSFSIAVQCTWGVSVIMGQPCLVFDSFMGNPKRPSILESRNYIYFQFSREAASPYICLPGDG